METLHSGFCRRDGNLLVSSKQLGTTALQCRTVVPTVHEACNNPPSQAHVRRHSPFNSQIKERNGNFPFWLLSPGWKPAWPLRAVERQRIQSSFANGTNNRLNRQSFSQYPYRASYRGLHNNQKACTRRHNLLAVGAIRAVGLGASRRPSIGSFAKLISLR